VASGDTDGPAVTVVLGYVSVVDFVAGSWQGPLRGGERLPKRWFRQAPDLFRTCRRWLVVDRAPCRHCSWPGTTTRPSPCSTPGWWPSCCPGARTEAVRGGGQL